MSLTQSPANSPVITQQVDTENGDLIALKRFRGGNPREGLAHHALAEALVLTELHGENKSTSEDLFTAGVISPSSSFFYKSQLYLALPLAGCDLEALLSAAAAAAPSSSSDGSPRLLSVPLAAAIAHSLLQSLASIHDTGFLHHDVKPGNVLLAVERGAPRHAGAEGATDKTATAEGTRTAVTDNNGNDGMLHLSGKKRSRRLMHPSADGDSDGDGPSGDIPLASPSHTIANGIRSVGLATPAGSTGPVTTNASPTGRLSGRVLLCDLGLADRRTCARPVDASVEASAAAYIATELAPPPPPQPQRQSDGQVTDGEDGDDEAEPWDDWESAAVSHWDGGMRQQVATVPWRPPELLFGARRHDVEVDAWGAGVVIFEILRAALVPPQSSSAVPISAPPSSGLWGSAGISSSAAGVDAAHRLFPQASELEVLSAQARLLGQASPRVWPALAAGNSPALPGYMELAPTCGHCCGRDDTIDADEASKLADSRAHESAVLARLREAANSCGTRGLAQLLRDELCDATGSSRSEPQSALYHAHGVAALAEWTGLARQASPMALSELATALSLFEAGLRMTAYDPLRRLSPAAALSLPTIAPIRSSMSPGVSASDATSGHGPADLPRQLSAAIAGARAHQREEKRAQQERRAMQHSAHYRGPGGAAIGGLRGLMGSLASTGAPVAGGTFNGGAVPPPLPSRIPSDIAAALGLGDSSVCGLRAVSGEEGGSMYL